MSRLRLLAVVTCVVAAASGAVVIQHNRSTPTAERELSGGTWRLAAVGSSVVDATTRRTATFEIDGHGRFNADDTTNDSAGSVTVTSTELRFSAIGSTSVGVGIDPVREAVDDVITEGSARWSLHDSELTLSRRGRILHFHRGSTVAPTRLVGTSWVFVTWGSPTSGFNPGHTFDVTVRFVDAHTIVAGNACTHLRARYRTTATQLIITDSVASPDVCRHTVPPAVIHHVLGDGTTSWDWNGTLWLQRNGRGVEYGRP